MGWFWSDGAAPAPKPEPASQHGFGQQQSQHPASPPPGCPMHKRTVDALSSSAVSQHPSAPSSSPSSCPVKHGSCPVPHGSRSAATQLPGAQQQAAQQPQQDASFLSKLNPLNYMFHSISQAPAPNQTQALPTTRDESSIPRGSGDGNWEYPSPQQMYNALLRKGYTDTDVTAVESMVAVHNFLNEGAWSEIVEWERRFAGGLARGWRVSRRGEANAPMELRRLEAKEARENNPDGGASAAAAVEEPTLIRFQGRPNDMTPRAAMLQALGWLYPSKYGTEPPFDRHDWYVSRNANGKEKEIRYVIDYYSGPPEPTGEPVFYLDVRPAMSVTGAAERLVRWGGDVWYRASGAEVREANKLQGRS